MARRTTPTWRYEIGAGCRLRVIKRYEDCPIPRTEYLLADHRVKVIRYLGAGFGVKAYARLKPGSAELFDACSRSQADAFAQDVDRLITVCAASGR